MYEEEFEYNDLQDYYQDIEFLEQEEAYYNEPLPDEFEEYQEEENECEDW